MPEIPPRVREAVQEIRSWRLLVADVPVQVSVAGIQVPHHRQFEESLTRELISEPQRCVLQIVLRPQGEAVNRVDEPRRRRVADLQLQFSLDPGHDVTPQLNHLREMIQFGAADALNRPGERPLVIVEDNNILQKLGSATLSIVLAAGAAASPLFLSGEAAYAKLFAAAVTATLAVVAYIVLLKIQSRPRTRQPTSPPNELRPDYRLAPLGGDDV